MMPSNDDGARLGGGKGVDVGGNRSRSVLAVRTFEISLVTQRKGHRASWLSKCSFRSKESTQTTHIPESAASMNT